MHKNVLDCLMLKCFIRSGLRRASAREMNLPPGAFRSLEAPDGVVL
jgi:hypothetical protein